MKVKKVLKPLSLKSLLLLQEEKHSREIMDPGSSSKK
jgi:hypothetical protein